MRTLPFAAVVLAALILLPATASARTESTIFQVQSYAPWRAWDEVASVPLGITRGPVRARYRAGGVTYVGIWANVSISRGSTTEILSEMRRRAAARFSAIDGAFIDRRLTAAERRRFVQVADLYRDADVLVVAAGHPACAGLTRAQARGIAAGRVRRWSQVVSGATRDAIAVRYLRSPSGVDEPRLGTALIGATERAGYARGARPARDGGIAAARRGDHGIAAVTTWSLARRAGPGVCAVPLNGVAPTDETVRLLRYPEAYPVTYVWPRSGARYPLARVLRREFARYLRSARVASSLAASGVLVTGRTPPAAGPPSGGSATAPTRDHLGRPITTTRAVAAATAALTGLRLEADTDDGRTRIVIDPGNVARRLFLDRAGVCTHQQTGGWTLVGGWRYAENGGGLVARLGWFADPGVRERLVVLPDGEPDAGYVDGVPHARVPGAAGTCG